MKEKGCFDQLPGGPECAQTDLQGLIQLQRDTLTTPFKEICISVIYHICPQHFCKVNKSWLNKKYQSSQSEGEREREKGEVFV